MPEPLKIDEIIGYVRVHAPAKQASWKFAAELVKRRTCSATLCFLLDKHASRCVDKKA